MKIYDENQFTKSKLDEREKGDSLGLEGFDPKDPIFKKSKTITWERLKNVVNKMLKHVENIDNKDGRYFDLKIPTIYGLCHTFLINTNDDGEIYIVLKIITPWMCKASDDPDDGVARMNKDEIYTYNDATDKLRYSVHSTVFKRNENIMRCETIIQIEPR